MQRSPTRATGMPQQDENDLDQEWGELLNEVRVVLPGVQVLFAFLLTLPFSNRFNAISNLDQTIYFAAFTLAAFTSLLLTAPGVIHRLQWRKHQKEHTLQVSTKLVIVSSLLLAAAMAAVVFLVTDLLYGSVAGATVTGAIVGTIAWLWYGVPLIHRWRRSGSGAA